MIRGSEYMASFPVLRAPVIETNIEDFLFSKSTKQRYPECSFSQFWQYLVFRVSLKCDADFLKDLRSLLYNQQQLLENLPILVQVHSICTIAWFFQSSFNFRPCFQHLPLTPFVTLNLMNCIFVKASPVTTVQPTTASRSFPDQSEYIVMSCLLIVSLLFLVLLEVLKSNY